MSKAKTLTFTPQELAIFKKIADALEDSTITTITINIKKSTTKATPEKAKPSAKPAAKTPAKKPAPKKAVNESKFETAEDVVTHFNKNVGNKTEDQYLSTISGRFMLIKDGEFSSAQRKLKMDAMSWGERDDLPNGLRVVASKNLLDELVETYGEPALIIPSSERDEADETSQEEEEVVVEEKKKPEKKLEEKPIFNSELSAFILKKGATEFAYYCLPKEERKTGPAYVVFGKVKGGKVVPITDAEVKGMPTYKAKFAKKAHPNAKDIAEIQGKMGSKSFLNVLPNSGDGEDAEAAEEAISKAEKKPVPKKVETKPTPKTAAKPAEKPTTAKSTTTTKPAKESTPAKTAPAKRIAKTPISSKAKVGQELLDKLNEVSAAQKRTEENLKKEQEEREKAKAQVEALKKEKGKEKEEAKEEPEEEIEATEEQEVEKEQEETVEITEGGEEVSAEEQAEKDLEESVEKKQ